MKQMHALLAVLVPATLATLAAADTITASFTYDNLQNVTIASPVYNGAVNTVSFHWTRKDTPGPGIDAGIAVTFDTYCVDLAQTVSTGTNNLFDVVSPAAHGFTAQQSTMLANLWGTYQGGVDSAQTSAAFQIAVWEIAYDTDLNVSTGLFHVTGAGIIATTAQGWLDTIAAPGFGYSGPALTLYVLQSSTLQDQFTPVPTPGTAALALLGSVSVMRRRRR